MIEISFHVFSFLMGIIVGMPIGIVGLALIEGGGE